MAKSLAMKDTPKFPQARAWAEYQRITIDTLLQRFPELESAWGEADENLVTLRDYFREQAFLLIEGNIRVSSTQAAELGSLGVRVVVDGCLDIQGSPSRFAYVSGDLYCDHINLTGSFSLDGWDGLLSFPATGRVFARCLAEGSAEDHESMTQLPELALETPYLFLWFCKFDDVLLPESTIVFIMGDSDYCPSQTQSNLIFPWHTSLHVISPKFCSAVEGSGSDSPYWDKKEILSILAKGGSIFKPGFDPACMDSMNTGNEAISLCEWQQAWAAYGEAARISPNYAPAWYGMGEALYFAHDYEQAMGCYLKAAEHFPQDQESLANDGLNMAALCALRLQQWQRSIDLATQSIEFNKAAKGYWKEDFAFAYRIRGEARMLAARNMNDPSKGLKDNAGFTAAGDDLRKALELQCLHGSSNWVMGLWHFLRNENSQAHEYHDYAQRLSKTFSPWYDLAPDSNALLPPPTTQTWAPIKPGSRRNKDEAYWCRYLSSTGPDGFMKVPSTLRTSRVCMAAIEGKSGKQEIAAQFPREAFTPELARCLIRASGANLKYVPPTLLDKPLCLQAPKAAGQFDASSLPAELFDQELARHALACGASLKDIPRTLLTKELCYLAIRENTYALGSTPPELLDETCYLTAIAFGSPYFFDNQIPSIFKTLDFLKRALELDKQALDTISGHAFCPELLEYAQKLYGNDPDWMEIVARHSPEQLAEGGAPAQSCWEALWTEEFMLEQIKKKNVSPWEIPAHRYTQAVAEAAFRSNPIHLDLIPRNLIQPWMAREFSAMYPDLLERIPVALRTPELCNAAVASDARNLIHVPLAHRSPDLCYRAMIDNPDYEEAIPWATYAEVFDRLLKSPAEHNCYRNWLLLCRGTGNAHSPAPDYESALKDYRAVLADPLGEDGEDIIERHQQAWYLMSKCLQQLDRHEEAQACLEKLDDPEIWSGLDIGAWAGPAAPVDFDKPRFSTLKEDIDHLKNVGIYDLAWSLNTEAEGMLVTAGYRDQIQWAYVLDNKRFLAYELERWDDNERACQEIIEQLGGSDLWNHLDADDVIRHALQGAHYRLALLDINDETPIDDLKGCCQRLQQDVLENQDLTQMDASLEPYLEGYAWVLLLLSRHRDDYAETAHQVLQRIKSSHLIDSNSLRIPLVINALTEERQEHLEEQNH